VRGASIAVTGLGSPILDLRWLCVGAKSIGKDQSFTFDHNCQPQPQRL
jgi:hypothetical protein